MANINADRGVHPLFHPVSHYDSPTDVLNDAALSTPEKRVILSSWASDMYAVESRPALREVPGMPRPIQLADILNALRELDDDDDDPPRGGGVPMRLRRPWAAALRRRAGSGARRSRALHRIERADRRQVAVEALHLDRGQLAGAPLRKG